MEPLAHLVDSSLRAIDRAMDPRSGFASGRLVRLRRGFYVPTSAWLEAQGHERFRLAVAAYARACPGAVFCGETAVFLHGLPVVRAPLFIDVVVRGSTRLGVRPNTFDVRGDSAAALRARNAPPPPIRRHHHEGVDIVAAGEYSTIPLADALAEVFAAGRFARALTVADGMLRASHVASLHELPELTQAIAALRCRAHRERAMTLVSLARGGAESPGESVSRALIHLFGFPEPALQKEFRDSRGFIGRTDFAWDIAPEPVGEFDGWGKYFSRELTGGEDPREVISREKRRESRLLALGHPVLRWDWSELERPEFLRAKLLEGGLRPERSPLVADRSSWLAGKFA
ncbi:hypothetical protein SPF06_03680 [Sinomonas sp. JGH33]|uniref:Transcriptional regulator, AbiEi antitoxin, Type IV TA system n=1 Tax=Sinomonas terricola TaxID=3110330 RepID=A0ABU5T2D4_9MICC|nr:hypothetical protein [Sinomonas sp. JGH33]MEA5453814.1 hypothetical protein [Sinomonas sp. JGH33]